MPSDDDCAVFPFIQIDGIDGACEEPPFFAKHYDNAALIVVVEQGSYQLSRIHLVPLS